jgi:single-stranded-DNA-specific exonuclease
MILKEWILEPIEHDLNNEILELNLESELSYQIIARILSFNKIKNNMLFLNPTLKDSMPNPFSLHDMESAVIHTKNFINDSLPIAVFGDYDVDGATSTALLVNFFNEINTNVTLYIPDRIEEGYGPNINSINTLFDQNIKLIIMCDCGTTSFEALDHANNLGIKVIILDHHISTDELPKATAIINPNRKDHPTKELSNLCAAGVTFMFIVALTRHMDLKINLFKMLDLVALGTVCDVMKLTELNRAFVHQGLKIINQKHNLGLKTLSQVANISKQITTYHLGYVIGPRINAGGRVGKSNLGSKLLSSNDPKESINIAMQLDVHNLERQEIEKKALEEAINKVNETDPFILLGDDNWHPGIIGIVAGRLKDKFLKPTCIVSFDDNIGKGSGRSITNVNLGDLMHKAVSNGLLIKGGGHALAAGFTVKKENFEKLHDFFKSETKELVERYVPKISIDGGVLTKKMLQEIHKISSDLKILEPHGMGNPAPKFLIKDFKITEAKVFATKHLTLFGTSSSIPLKVTAFYADIDTLKTGMVLDLVVQIKDGLILEDFKIHI